MHQIFLRMFFVSFSRLFQIWKLHTFWLAEPTALAISKVYYFRIWKILE